MGRRRKNTPEWENEVAFQQYYKWLTELTTSVFEWKNLPETVDARFLEMTLFSEGQAVFFKDEEIGFLCLQVKLGGGFTVYRVPIQRDAYAVNGYNRRLDNTNSVIIYNNFLRSNSVEDVCQFSRRLANLDRTIDVNVNGQKTPILLQCSEQQRLTVVNAYEQYTGNMPVIFADKNLDLGSFKALATPAPYVSDKLYQLKTQYWNEAMTRLGIPNVNVTKKERLITDEVQRTQGGTIASRYTKLEMRRQAAEEINKMFDLNVQVDYRTDFNPEVEPDDKEDFEDE